MNLLPRKLSQILSSSSKSHLSQREYWLRKWYLQEMQDIGLRHTSVIAMAQQQGRRVVVVTMEQIKAVQTTDDFAALLRDEFLRVVGSDGF